MAITIQALQADGTWAVRNAFISENAEVLSGYIKAADLEAKARKIMSQWQTNYQDGKQLRLHNSANDPKPAPRKPKIIQREAPPFGTWEVTQAELEVALSLSEGDDALAEAAYQVVRYCRGQIFHRDMATEALRMIRQKVAA